MQNPIAAGITGILLAEPAIGAICAVFDAAGCLVAVLITPVVVSVSVVLVG